MSDVITDRERLLVIALERISEVCDYRSAARTPDELSHLLMAIDVAASLALLMSGEVDLVS